MNRISHAAAVAALVLAAGATTCVTASAAPSHTGTVVANAASRTGFTTTVGREAALRPSTVAPKIVWHPGGCNKETRGPFTASACTSDTGFAGVDFNSDAYIDAKPNGCFYLEIDLRDANANKLATGDWQRFCGTGHFLGPTFSGQKYNQPYYSELTIASGNQSYVIDSPYIGYTWN
ncbi:MULTISPECIES: hypothetical protein [unclassified Streptomyces]|uniref:hypothetical protein n=1 Tax=unclassified Streptomyces TaxID=2593676 RepID=UPI00224E9E5E|nr:MULTISPECIES: hypothetical protein [unclassified Streptomyces]MCX5063868.1 hypothetical protein [Streptomyces sp. NBC_00452]